MIRLLTTAFMLAIAATFAHGHSTAEQDGLFFVFGGSPEPALNDEMITLQWMVSAADAERGAPRVSGLIEDLSVTLEVNGETYGPFEPEEGFGEPGIYSTSHVFASAGEFHGTLTFRKAGSEEVQSLTLPFHIVDRNELIIGD